MFDISRIPEFIGQISTNLSQIDVGNFMGHTATYSKDILLGIFSAVGAAAIALAILYVAYRLIKTLDTNSKLEGRVQALEKRHQERKQLKDQYGALNTRFMEILLKLDELQPSSQSGLPDEKAIERLLKEKGNIEVQVQDIRCKLNLFSA